jgi:hypothetical protein
MHAACPLSGANATLGRIYAHTPKPQAVEAKDRGPGSALLVPGAIAQPRVILNIRRQFTMGLPVIRVLNLMMSGGATS